MVTLYVVSLASWSEFSAHGPMHELFHNDFFWRSRGAAIEKKDKMGLIAMYIGMDSPLPV